MIKEEILQYIKSELANEDAEIYLDIDDYKVIVEALEQKPCEDCISRQALINAFPISDTYTLEDIIATIKFLPPVTPTRKKGKWKKRVCWMYV